MYKRQGDAGVEELHPVVGPVQVHILLHVAAVGDHDAHADAEGEEELAHGVQHHVQEAGDRHAGEVRLQVDGEALELSLIHIYLAAQAGPGLPGLDELVHGVDIVKVQGTEIQDLHTASHSFAPEGRFLPSHHTEEGAESQGCLFSTGKVNSRM